MFFALPCARSLVHSHRSPSQHAPSNCGVLATPVRLPLRIPVSLWIVFEKQLSPPASTALPVWALTSRRSSLLVSLFTHGSFSATCVSTSSRRSTNKFHLCHHLLTNDRLFPWHRSPMCYGDSSDVVNGCPDQHQQTAQEPTSSQSRLFRTCAPSTAVHACRIISEAYPTFASVPEHTIGTMLLPVSTSATDNTVASPTCASTPRSLYISASMTMITHPVSSLWRDLTCPEGQGAWALAPSLFGEDLASCRKMSR